MTLLWTRMRLFTACVSTQKSHRPMSASVMRAVAVVWATSSWVTVRVTPPLFCWCSKGGTVSRHRKGLRSLGGIHDDKAAEKVAIAKCSGCDPIGPVPEFTHP